MKRKGAITKYPIGFLFEIVVLLQSTHMDMLKPNLKFVFRISRNARGING